jgi:RHS repeat-associated protein
MGNVMFLLNASGAGVEKYIYDAFGSPTITNFNNSPRTSNRFMFSGREYLSALGLYDLRHRVYDPVMGRFYQIDPIRLTGDLTNLYRFCHNNPLLGGDPIGEYDSISLGDATHIDFNNLGGGVDSSAVDAGSDAGGLGSWQGSYPTTDFSYSDNAIGYWGSSDSSYFDFAKGSLSDALPMFDARLAPVAYAGTLAVDTDGTLTRNFYADPNGVFHTSAWRDLNGNLVPQTKGIFPLDANSDIYGVLPAGRTPGMFQLGDSMTIIRTDTAASITTQGGDYGPLPPKTSSPFGELSVAGVEALGAAVVPSKSGPVPAGSNIPVIIIIRPGSYATPVNTAITAPVLQLQLPTHR